MRLLLVAATLPEVAPLAGILGPVSTGLTRHGVGPHGVDGLVTGVGMVATAAGVARALAVTAYDAALNLGVCGSFDRSRPLASVVHVTTDCLPELGVEDGPAFVPAADVGLLDPQAHPYSGGVLVNDRPPVWPALRDLPEVVGVTVNTVHGHEPSIAVVRSRTRADVESMEGAAFLYACLSAGVPCAQVRAVSNYVERRNREAWYLAGAIEAVNAAGQGMLEAL